MGIFSKLTLPYLQFVQSARLVEYSLFKANLSNNEKIGSGPKKSNSPAA
jgi:hypothetical protein